MLFEIRVHKKYDEYDLDIPPGSSIPLELPNTGFLQELAHGERAITVDVARQLMELLMSELDNVNHLHLGIEVVELEGAPTS